MESRALNIRPVALENDEKSDNGSMGKSVWPILKILMPFWRLCPPGCQEAKWLADSARQNPQINLFGLLKSTINRVTF
jgi:hypothetical protein